MVLYTAWPHPFSRRSRNWSHATAGSVSGPSNTRNRNENNGVGRTSATARLMWYICTAGEALRVSGRPAAGFTA